MDPDYMHKQAYTEEVKRTQPESANKQESKQSSGDGCRQCCLKTRNCVMSPECGRALSIANVIAMCGMCIRMWT